MKKLLAIILSAIFMLSFATVATAEGDFSVAMITDYGDITDQSFNQTTYEACKAYCDANGVNFSYFKPTGDSDAERTAMMETAIDEGYNVIVAPGYAFGGALREVVGTYPDVYFIGIDVSSGDLGADFVMTDNLYCVVYQEELCGYMAGYAAVKFGYNHIGFLGGMAVPAVVRYGYGFVQGANAAAEADGKTDVVVEYVYGNQFYGDADITAYMDNWFQTLGVEVVFPCGGGIYTSAAEAAAKVGGKIIGVDTDQKPVIDGMYGEGITLTSAMKGLGEAVDYSLTKIAAGEFADLGGKMEVLGLVSENPEENYVLIPMDSTPFDENFSMDDYKAMIADMLSGKLVVSDDITVDAASFGTVAKVNVYDNIK
ncbi:MAG: BMP family lipoprotein [Christensenellales bacterium]|jgi:basic membrane protein A